MTPWSFDLWDHLIALDPERAIGSGACYGLLDMLMSFWASLTE